MAVDELDTRILRLLLEQPRTSVREYARLLGIARGTLQARLDRLERTGVITGTGPALSPAALGHPVLAFVHIEVTQGHLDEVGEALAGVPEIVEAFSITGGGDLLTRVVARDNAHLEDVIQQLIRLPGWPTGCCRWWSPWAGARGGPEILVGGSTPGRTPTQSRTAQRMISVIFDLDGTLVDSEPNYYESGRRTLERHGVPGFTWEEHSRFIGIGTLETLEVLRERYGIGAPVEQLLAEQNAAYLELARARTEAYPQMRALVERLHADGVPMAVASGSSREAIDAVLSGTGLDARLTTVVSAEEVAHGKPAPDVFLEAARQLGADPADCVVVEDAAPGAQAAHAAGMGCVAVPYTAAAAADPAFATAGLVFPDGQAGFRADAAYDWLRARAGDGWTA
jgi:HAD superfamily hydrolase (TIGR01509 family)